MNKLTRYLLRHLTVTMLFVTLGLTMIIWLTQALRLIEVVVEGGAPMSLFLQLMAVTLPTFLAVVLPLALVASILFTYNRLIMDSEIVVMQSAGQGPLALAKPALILASVVTLLCFAITLDVAPAANRHLVELERLARSAYSTVLLREGVFNDVDKGLTVYVREREPDGSLAGLLIHDTRVPDKPVTVLAERGIVGDGPAGPRVIVFDGQRQEFDRLDGRLSQLFFDRYALDMRAIGGTARQRTPDARERSTVELIDLARDEGDPATRNYLMAELHSRFTAPLSALGFAIVGLAALLSGEFNRRGQARRIMGAMTAVVLLESASLGASNLAANRGSLVPLMYVIALLPVVGGLWYLLRTPRWRARPAAA